MKKILETLNQKWSCKNITINEAEDIQFFLILMDDFFQLCEGKSCSADELLQACPSTSNIKTDKFVLGIYKDKTLIGIMDLIQNYPKNGVWTIGYLLIHPKYQGHEIGSNFLRDLQICLKNDKVLKLRCVVQSQNPKALCFWQKNNFVIEKEIQQDLGKLINRTFILEKTL